jgi:preprotein translocase subunit YajC
MYFMLIKPQKKRERQVNEMRSNLRVGDDIITIGGICGKIVKTKEDTIIIQVGADKLKFEMMRWSVSKVVDKVEMQNIRVREDEYEEEEAPKARPQRLQKAAHDEPADVEETAEEVAETAESADDAIGQAVKEAENTAEDAVEEVDAD